MPGTFSPSPQVSDTDMHHGTCVTHVPWCMPGSLTSGFFWKRRRGKTSPACATCNFTYLLRGPWPELSIISWSVSPSIMRWCQHYNEVIMGMIASQITSLTMVFSAVYSGADKRKHQSSASLAFVRGIHRGPVNFPLKWPVTRKMFPFDDVIMTLWHILVNGRLQRIIYTRHHAREHRYQ